MPSAIEKRNGVRVGIEKGILVGVGAPLLDMITTVDSSYLDKYGLKPDDAILAQESHMPIFKDIEKKFNVDYVAGGATLNTLRVGQWLLKKKHVFSFCGGSLGEDNLSKSLINDAENLGVNMKCHVSKDLPTGKCAVLLTEENNYRSMVTSLGAASHFNKAHLVDPKIWQIVENADYFYIEGFFVKVSLDSLLEIALHCSERNKYVMINLSAPYICQNFAKHLQRCFPYIDVLFGNETEAAAFAKQQRFGTDDIKSIALKLASIEKFNKNRARIVIITRGSDPTIVVSGGIISEYAVVPIIPDNIVDTNGAGDAFVGGFLSQFIQGKKVSRCIEVAHYAANYIIQQSGVDFTGEPDI